ncbi:Fungal Zn2-Cys6 binuclear cluster domain-containing protein [Cladophialophora immunda]|nr:Fungal Zn2-Cys6 binuclear cluster domain-containing protein [Cladophialophora immunda]
MPSDDYNAADTGAQITSVNVSARNAFDDTGTSEDDENNNRPAKRPRNFIARQACERCRARKTRCDQETPCSLCKSLGVHCVYTERKPTRNEASLSMIFNRLKRIETQISRLTRAPIQTSPQGDAGTTGPPALSAESLSPQQFPNTHRLARTAGDSKLSFSARQALYWLGLLPEHSSTSFPTRAEGLGVCLADGEFDGPALPENVQTEEFPPDWLESLSLSTVKALSNAFFSTFNRIFPVVDRDYYFLHSLSTVVREGFNDDIESCLVLAVMALGCLGAKAFEEGGYHNEDVMPATGIIQTLMNQDVPGKGLFNESRRRIGLCSDAKDIQVSQYYLAAALFHAQSMRPVDQWMMTDRAGAGPTKKPSPRARDVVPLPRFLAYPNAKKLQPVRKDDSYYHYHFLAQIAHRIILTRIRDEMYHLNPSTRVANELRHQLDQWYRNLPSALQLDGNLDTFSCPAEAVAMSLLQTRYRSALYHLGRPFLYKALTNSCAMTDQELNFCSEALQTASDWPIATGSCKQMDSFSPLKYFVCRSFFGTLLIAHALKKSHNERLVATLPQNSDALCSYMLHYIEGLAPLSPALQKDLELLFMLYEPPDH